MQSKERQRQTQTWQETDREIEKSEAAQKRLTNITTGYIFINNNNIVITVITTINDDRLQK